jgi:Zn-dependent peptidase ImmA (M78 family)/DNA-binding XRE family transcriptional regulator
MTRGVNGELLVVAREAMGLTQEEVAVEVKISQSILSKYENSLHQPSEEHIARIAECLHSPVSFFYLPDAPLAAGTCLYHRKQASMPRMAQRRLDSSIKKCRLHVSRLLDGAKLSAPLSFPRLDIADHNFDIPKIAEMVRVAWRLPRGPVRNLIQTIERAGGLVVCMDFGTQKLSAICHSETPPMFFVNSDIPADRFRFTLAHEIGHLVMHHTPTPDQEKEADRFAAEFLMPAADICPDLAGMTLARAAELKPFWRVAMSAIVRRARDLNVVTEWQYQRMMMDMNHRKWRMCEPVDIAPETPTLLPQLIERHLVDLGYSVPELAELMRMREDDLRWTFGINAGPRIVR